MDDRHVAVGSLSLDDTVIHDQRLVSPSSTTEPFFA